MSGEVRSVAVLADAVDRAVCDLNRATLSVYAVEVADAYAVLGSLSRVAFNLMQAVRQVESAVARRHVAGDVFSTGDVEADVRAIVGLLGGAPSLLADLEVRLSAAHEACSRLGSV